MRFHGFRCVAMVVAASCGTALGVSYIESVNGDLSGARLVPTDVGVLSLGSNVVSGTTTVGDLDYWRITIPAGAHLAQMVLTGWVSTDDIAFIAIQPGTQFTEPSSGTNVANLLGWTHFGTAVAASPGTDILDNLGAGAGAIGFTPPLAAGDYVFWTQQTVAVSVGYTFDLVVAAVPPPACTGDVNGDGFTNAVDFNLLAGDFGCSP